MAEPRPVRLRLSRAKGFSLQALSLATNGLPAVNVARPSRWGNIYHIARDDGWCVYDENDQFMLRALNRLDARRIAVNKFRSWAERWVVLIPPKLMLNHLEKFRGHNVACWCELDGGPCHGDWWLEWANRPTCEAV